MSAKTDLNTKKTRIEKPKIVRLYSENLCQAADQDKRRAEDNLRSSDWEVRGAKLLLAELDARVYCVSTLNEKCDSQQRRG